MSYSDKHTNIWVIKMNQFLFIFIHFIDKHGINEMYFLLNAMNNQHFSFWSMWNDLLWWSQWVGVICWWITALCTAHENNSAERPFILFSPHHLDSKPTTWVKSLSWWCRSCSSSFADVQTPGKKAALSRSRTQLLPETQRVPVRVQGL